MFGASSVLTSSGPTPRPDAAACNQMKEVTWKPAKDARNVFICSIGPLRISRHQRKTATTTTEQKRKRSTRSTHYNIGDGQWASFHLC